LQFLQRGRLLESRAHFQKRPHPASRVEAAPLVDHIDVFLDLMSMDHDVDVRGRLDIDDYAISPVDVLITKLQIGRIAAKDVHDVVALLKDLELGARSDDRSSTCRTWRSCADATGVSTTTYGATSTSSVPGSTARRFPTTIGRAARAAWVPSAGRSSAGRSRCAGGCGPGWARACPGGARSRNGKARRPSRP
jgi:hypothetical protein